MRRKFLVFFVVFLFFVSGCIKSKHITVQKNCLEIKEDLSWSTNPQEVLVLSAGETIFFDGKKKILLDYEGDAVRCPMVSPDHKTWIASIDHGVAIVRKSDGEIVKIDYYGSWLDSETLLITPPYFHSDLFYKDRVRKDALPLGTVYLYNPFTDELKEIPSTFAGLYPLKYRTSSDGETRALNPILDLNKVPFPFFIYNSSLSRVLLFINDERGMRHILWDTQKEEIVWEKKLNNPHIEPKWSPNGTQIAVTDVSFSSGIVLVDINGRETEFVAPPETYWLTGTFDWSPDGRYIAGYWAKDENYSLRLTVLDTKTREMIDYCVEGGGDIIWSPSGKQIAIHVKVDKGGGSSRPGTVVVDIENRTAVKVSNSLYPVGWMLADE